MTHLPHPVGPVDETSEQRRVRRADQCRHDLAVLAAGGETGWWDEHGVPAPWPDDFFDADTEWRSGDNQPDLTPGERRF
jgi:hypothetical protein